MNAITPTVTEGPLPASRKIYVSGNVHKDIRVPMRRIELHPTAGEPGVTVYDSSGPYTDDAVETDIAKGLPQLRRDWVLARGDVESYDGRQITDADNGFVSEERMTPEFPVKPKPLRAKDGKAVTQLAYARAGIAHYKVPRSIDFRDELPRLPTGKLYKRVLRDEYWGNKNSRIV